MNGWVCFYTIAFNERFGSIIVPLGFNALNLLEQIAKQATKRFVILDVQICISISDHFFNDTGFSTALKTPVADPSTVAHVGLFDVGTQLQTTQLKHHAVSDVAIVFCSSCFQGFHQSQLHHFLIKHEVQRDQIGTPFFQG